MNIPLMYVSEPTPEKVCQPLVTDPFFTIPLPIPIIIKQIETSKKHSDHRPKQNYTEKRKRLQNRQWNGSARH